MTSLSYLAAAEKVLAEVGKSKPMHYKDITRIAIERGWLLTRGLTPEVTLTAQIGTDNRRREARGEQPRFLVLGAGLYALSARTKTGRERQTISDAIEDANKATKEKLRDLLYKMPPRAFELLVGDLLSEAGYEDVEVTARSGDEGIDVRARLTAGGIADVNAAIQVKRYNKKNVQAPTIRELRGSLDPDEIGVVITTSDFSSGAKEEAQKVSRTPIKLISGADLVELLVQHSVGVNHRQLEVLELSAKVMDLVSDRVDGVPDRVDGVPDRVEDGSPETSITIIENPNVNMVVPTRRSVIKLPEGMLLRGQLKGQTFDAVVVDGKIRYEDQDYTSPSGAAMAATGWDAANGWVFWYYQDSNTGAWVSIAQLRKSQE